MALSAVPLHSRSVGESEGAASEGEGESRAVPGGRGGRCCGGGGGGKCRGGGLTEGYLEIAPWPKYGSSNQSKSVCELRPPLPQTFRRIKITLS